MANKYFYEMLSPVAQPGVAMRILERNEHGGLVGEYKGYYRPKTCTFTLYPAFNVFASGNANIKKKTIWASDVRYKGKKN